MTTHFPHDCPHCQTRAAGFGVAFQWNVRGVGNLANILALCGVCNKGITLLSLVKGPHQHPNLLQNSVTYPGNQYNILEVSPIFKATAPQGIPVNIEGFYLQGLENLHARRWDAAGAMFRKTLDTATKVICSELKGMTLYARINKLVEQGLLTSAMGDWSHEIRLDGNSAVHDEEPETESDAKTTQKFTEAFLNYAFTLPSLVSTSRANRASAEALNEEEAA